MIRKTELGRLTRRSVRRGLGWLGSAYSRQISLRASKVASAPTRTLEWVRRHESPSGGIRVHSYYSEAYPEVTGYLVPTLLQYGERELATRFVRWLMCIQRGDGAFTDPNEGRPNVFDTGQVLRGLLAGGELVPQAFDAARRAADYLCAEMQDGGRGGFGARYRGEWYREIPESIHLYALPPLYRAAEVFQDTKYKTAAEQCLEYYCSHKDGLNIGTLTHYLAYELEALIDLGQADLATPVLEELRANQSADGAIRGAAGVRWICAPGLAQLAICWYKLGHWESADQALKWLEAHQRPYGGFLGSYGENASYLANEEPSWAAKFFLDAHTLRVQSFFQREAASVASSISRDDGRVKAILSVLRPHDRVLNVGCGYGRFLKVVREAFPGIYCTGVDISAALLARVPADMRTLQGSPEAIPCPKDSFDVVFSVEAIEHSANMQAAVEEMVRVTRPGGWVVIIHKQRLHGGQLRSSPWQRCPEAAQLARWLRRGCDRVTNEPVSCEDCLMIEWKGQKRSPLSANRRTAVLTSAGSRREVVQSVRYNRVSEWGQVLLLTTLHAEKVLELGSGAGEISLHLARAGRRVTVVDSNTESLDFTRACAQELGLSIETIQADPTQRLTFGSDEFDCVWSMGLLERLSAGQRQTTLREWARIAAKAVIALVPNAACVAYRAGKTYQEEHGTWSYGLETPILSLRDDFEVAGLRVLSEYSVGAKHALSFLPIRNTLRTALSSWIESRPWSAANDCNQGYFLVTIGAKHPLAGR